MEFSQQRSIILVNESSLSVIYLEILVGYQNEEGEYIGFRGSLRASDYRLLNALAKKCTSPKILSLEQLNALSNTKDLIAKAQIRIYEAESILGGKKEYSEIHNAVGKALESFDAYRKDAPQLDFLLSFLIADLDNSHFDEEKREQSENFKDINATGENATVLSELIDQGVIKQILVPEDFVAAIAEWNELEGRTILDEASDATGDDEGVLETEIYWWRDNIAFYEEEPDLELTTMLFRAVRNNVLKTMRTKEPVLASGDWQKLIEVF